MIELLTNILRWIANKFVLLIILVAIFLGAKWFHSEWKGIADQIKQVEDIERQISNAEADLEDLIKKSKDFGAEAAQIHQHIKDLEKSYLDSIEVVKSEKKKFDKAKKLVGWFQRLFESDKVDQRNQAEKAYDHAFKRAEEITNSLSSLKKKHENAPWADHFRRVDAKRDEIFKLQDQRKDLVPSQKLILAIREVLPQACWTLVGIILTPLVIKAFLYFVLAPMISRVKPVRILPDSSGDVSVGSANVSIPLTLAPGENLMVHSAYLQAAGAGPGKNTLWLFSWRMPLTSLAAGLYAMVVVRNRSTENASVTVSPKADLFDKVSEIRISEGSAMVIYPRSLVGMVVTNGERPKITRRWNFSLHSWITFQFRYIVIHGKAHILIKGCRGVRAQQVEPTTPSMQDQLATLGFTANLAYSGVRCETFLDYLLGRDELFNDRFADASGFYLTEEVPRSSQRKGFFGRGLEGLTDGFLKAFGI